MKNELNKTIIVIGILIFAALLYRLSAMLTPFLAGILLAYLVNPFVKKLMKLHLPRLLAVVVVFSILFLSLALFIVLLIPIVERQVVLLGDVITNAIVWLQNSFLPWLNGRFAAQELMNTDALKTAVAENWAKAGGAATWLFKTVLKSGFALVQWTITLLLIPVVTFYLLRDWDKVLHQISALLPRKIQPTVVQLAKECDAVLSGFFRGQLLVMLSLGVFYAIGLTLVGLQVGLLVGLMAGLASIVPYLGLIVGVSAASVAAFMQSGNMSVIFPILLVFVAGQLLESIFLTPKLVGDRIGLHPVVVIFAVLAGGTLIGFFGILLALPVAAVLVVMMRFFYQHSRNNLLHQ